MLGNYLCTCCSVAKLSSTLCDPMDCSTPGFPVLHHLSNSCPLSLWCYPTILSSAVPFSFCFQSLPASGSFSMSQLLTSGGQSIGASTSASVLPMNIQGWFPLGLTGLISLQSKGLSRVFSSTTIQFSSSLVAQSCTTLSNLMDSSSPGLPIYRQSRILELMSIESKMPSNHLILCHPLLLPPSIFPSIRVFSKESILCIR